MTQEDFKRYIEEEQNTEEFKKLMEWIGIKCDNNMFDTLVEYLKRNHARTDTKDFLVPDFDHFCNFFDCYKKGNFSMVYKERGEIDLENTLYLRQLNISKSKTGFYTDSYIILADGTSYISKYPFYIKARGRIFDSSSQYNAVIATGVANQIGVISSENELAIIENGQRRLLSKFFLQTGEELQVFYQDEEDEIHPKISVILNKLHDDLKLRKYSDDEIKETMFNFLKQEFLAKLIGLCDQSCANTEIITSVDSQGNRHVRLAPMFDYDYSFFVAEDFEFIRRACDNGETDIGSLIKQYKDYPGFIDFVRNSISVLDMTKVYEDIYKRQHLELFQPPYNNSTLNKFTEFVNKNLELARKTVRELDANIKEEK